MYKPFDSIHGSLDPCYLSGSSIVLPKMAHTNAAKLLEQWVRDQPGGYLHPDVHISETVDDLGIHWRTSRHLDAGTRSVVLDAAKCHIVKDAHRTFTVMAV